MLTNRWVLASRPPTLWAGIAPVVVGTAIALDDEVFRLDVFAAVLVTAVAVQVGVNFANDFADAVRGADAAERIGPTRAVATGLITARAMRNGVVVAFGVAAAAGLYLATVAGPIVLALGAASLLAALGYTSGPAPYGYRGLGEVFVFVFFGLVATVGTRFVFDESAPGRAWICGVVMGLLAAAILIANNVRDIETDRDAGKRTLAVIIGRRASRWLYAATVVGAFLVIAVATPLGGLPAGALLAVAAAPLAATPIRSVATRVDGPGLVGALQATARLQIVTAVLLGAGLVI